MKCVVQRVTSRTGLIVVAITAAALLSACLPATPQAQPAFSKGFDACAAPSLTTMSKWKASSPYTSIGIYIGGTNRACAQPNLSASWVSSAKGQGWRMLPIWVGPQASCTTLSGTTKISGDPMTAFFQGVGEAQVAADAAKNLGLGWLAPIYYDMEGYPRGGTCSEAVKGFADGWVRQLNARGYLGGMYSSLCSGVLDAAAAAKDTRKVPLNAVWIAAWNNTPQIYGFGSPCLLADTIWNDHQRVHQYQGGHNESYGGVTINIDSNAVDAPTG